MKWLRTVIVFDVGEVVTSEDWTTIHASYKRAIQSIGHPVGGDKLIIRRKCIADASGKNRQWKRNGVGYLKSAFMKNITEREGWKGERPLELPADRTRAILKEFPSMKEYQIEKCVLGDFDFITAGKKFKIGLEWETGNISSSHRSLNKLVLALSCGVIQIGILIMPSRKLYEHLTDRIGNFEELSGYLDFWERTKSTVAKGLLAVTVVEHDELTDDDHIPYLPMGADGNSERAKQVRKG